METNCNQKKEGAEKPSLLATILSCYTKPWFCLLCAAAGVVVGLSYKSFAAAFEPAATIYMTLLALTVTPIVFSALAAGITTLITSGQARKYIGRLSLTLIFGTMTAAFLATFAGALAMPLLTKYQNRDFIGQALSNFENSGDAGSIEAQAGFWDFIENVVPSNAFGALASDNLLAVVFLAALLGLAICTVQAQRRATAVDMIQVVYETSLTVLGWVLCLLPIGLFCLMASQTAKVGPDALTAMLSVIVLYFICFAIMVTFYVIIIKRASGKSFRELYEVLKTPFTLAAIASSDSSLPILMEHMAKLGYQREMLRSVIPLSATMNRHATAMVFALTTLFVANIYDLELDFWQYFFIALACAFVGAFDFGEYVTIAPMVAYILIPLNLSSSAGVAIILTIWPMISSATELQAVMAACANAAITGNTGDELISENSQESL